MFPSSGTPGSVLRQALTAAASVLAGNGDTAGLGASPFTAFVTVDGKFAGNGSTPDELALIKLFQTGLPRDKQAAWLLYNLLPAAVNAAELGRLKTARTHLSDVVGSSDYDLAFSLPPDFALGGKASDGGSGLGRWRGGVAWLAMPGSSRIPSAHTSHL